MYVGRAEVPESSVNRRDARWRPIGEAQSDVHHVLRRDPSRNREKEARIMHSWTCPSNHELVGERTGLVSSGAKV